MVRIINIDTKARTIRVSNGKDDLEWFTTDTGSHVPLKKGQSKSEAIKEHFGDKKSDTKRVAAKIYSKLADRVGYVSDSDLEKYLDDNEYFNDDVREEIVKTVRELETQASERHSEKDAPKPTEQWQNPRPRDRYVEHEVEQIIKKQPAGHDKGTDENGTVWINVGGTIIPLRVRDNSGIDPKILATPEEIKRGRAKYEGIKDRQDTARAKAKSSKIMRE